MARYVGSAIFRSWVRGLGRVDTQKLRGAAEVESCSVMFFGVLINQNGSTWKMATNLCWLVVSKMAFIFHFTYGMSSFPLTNSYFSRWLKPPTSVYSSDIFSGGWVGAHRYYLQLAIASLRHHMALPSHGMTSLGLQFWLQNLWYRMGPPR